MVLSRLTKITGPGIKTDTNWVGNNANYTGILTASSLGGIGNINATGIITATKFVGPVEGNVTAVDGTFSGNVSIAGTLTYEDVTNVDSVGIITGKGADINGDLDVDGHTNLDNVSIAGVTTFNDNVRLLDGDRLQFGNSQDISIFHNGSHTLINKSGSGTGDLIFNIDQVIFKDTTGSDERLATNSKGIKVGTGVTIETNGQATFVGVVTFGSGSTTIDNNVVNVGTALTLGHTQGLQFHTQNLHAQGFEVNQINSSGIVTASSFSGSGASLTNLNGSQITSGTVPIARIGTGTKNTTTFFRGDGTFQVVNTDLVSDSSPQLGGDLESNTHNIKMADSSYTANNNKIYCGNFLDFKIYHDGTPYENILQSNGAVPIIIKPKDTDVGLKVLPDSGVELYWDNGKKLETTNTGVTVTGTVAATAFTGDGSNLTGLASREFYGFTGIGNSLSLTTTNSGADNIDGATYAAFEESFAGPSGISFSINTSGNLIMTV